ncbi:hypothetical protein WRSd5_03009 [Shigella dysenteriae WRSd5]|nr:hypothetical protein WRSd5_03009 [Shigella dysenteriae WRSd5]
MSSFAPLITTVAPSSSAIARRFSSTSTTAISVAPRHLHACNVIKPIQPAPRIIIFLPGLTSASIAACIPTAAGSTSAPSIVSILSGSL